MDIVLLGRVNGTVPHYTLEYERGEAARRLRSKRPPQGLEVAPSDPCLCGHSLQFTERIPALEGLARRIGEDPRTLRIPAKEDQPEIRKDHFVQSNRTRFPILGLVLFAEGDIEDPPVPVDVDPPEMEGLSGSHAGIENQTDDLEQGRHPGP